MGTATNSGAATQAEIDELMTPDEYLESLRDARNVYLYGEKVKDVTTHPAFRNSARSAARLYATWHDPAQRDLLTAVDDYGIRTHKFFKPSKSSQELFEAREAISRQGFVLVVEGYMDVVALAQFGVDNAVATLGTATTRAHLERLFRYTAEVVFCFDGDRAGRAAAWRALEQTLELMSDGRQVGFLFLPEGEDPDTFVRAQGAEAFMANARKPVPLPDFLFQSLAAQVDLGRLDGRARLVSLAQPLLAKLPSGALKELMTARLADISRVNPEKLSTLMRTPEAAAHRHAATAKPQGSRSKSTTSGRPTLVGAAISLLLQDLSLARSVPNPGVYANLELRGVRLLVDILEAGRAQPPPNTAAILERYRDTPYAETLARLAARSVPARLDIEFHDAIKRLDVEVIRQALNLLSSKERSGGLSDEEKTEFRRLNRELGLLSQAKRSN